MANKKFKTVKELKKFVGGNTFTVTFTKANGDTRVLKGTFNLDNIPTDKHPKGVKENTSKTVTPVFDLEKGEWRSIPVVAVKTIKVEA